jgi:hypothetical protein
MPTHLILQPLVLKLFRCHIILFTLNICILPSGAPLALRVSYYQLVFAQLLIFSTASHIAVQVSSYHQLFFAYLLGFPSNSPSDVMLSTLFCSASQFFLRLNLSQDWIVGKLPISMKRRHLSIGPWRQYKTECLRIPGLSLTIFAMLKYTLSSLFAQCWVHLIDRL